MQWWECPGGVPILTPHWDAIGKVWDIGWGHVFVQGETRRDITYEEADALFDYDLWVFDTGVAALVEIEVAQCVYDSLVAFAYNKGIGQKGLAGSTLLRLLNTGDLDGAADQFQYWNKAQGKVVDGLTRRSASMRAMFYGDYSRLP